MMLLADKHDYKRGYKKHIAAYQFLVDKNECVRSRCLLLIYSVECGLKYKLMDVWHETSTREWIHEKNDERAELIKSHNVQNLLKGLHQEGTFHFPTMKTIHNQDVSTNTYHQLCRYGIEVKDKYGLNARKYEEILVQIAEWIGEEI